MTREQFLYLAGQLFDAQAGNAAPSGGTGIGDGRAPKFDTVLPAGNGLVIYASECSLKELTYQQNRASKPPKDPKYIQANEKRVKALGYWISYRQTAPNEQRHGDRNRTPVTAAPPSDKPAKHEKDAPPSTQSFAGPSAGASDTGDIQFAPIPNHA